MTGVTLKTSDQANCDFLGVHPQQKTSRLIHPAFFWGGWDGSTSHIHVSHPKWLKFFRTGKLHTIPELVWFITKHQSNVSVSLVFHTTINYGLTPAIENWVTQGKRRNEFIEIQPVTMGEKHLETMSFVVAEGFKRQVSISGVWEMFFRIGKLQSLGFLVKFMACKRRKDDDQPKKNAWVENPPHIIGDLTWFNPQIPNIWRMYLPNLHHESGICLTRSTSRISQSGLFVPDGPVGNRRNPEQIYVLVHTLIWQ